MTRGEKIGAGVAGLLVASGLLSFLYWRRLERYKADAARWTAPTGEAARIRRNLDMSAAPMARQIARQSAEQHLAQAYGLTPARIQSVEQLVRALS